MTIALASGCHFSLVMRVASHVRELGMDSVIKLVMEAAVEARIKLLIVLAAMSETRSAYAQSVTWHAPRAQAEQVPVPVARVPAAPATGPADAPDPLVGCQCAHAVQTWAAGYQLLAWLGQTEKIPAAKKTS